MQRAKGAASRSLSTIPLTSPEHISRVHPEFVHEYGRFWWLDPGEPEVRAYVVRIVRDIVRRYDVDAIHFDDYFYPYPENNLEFPDDESFRRYNAGLPRDEWRRGNVNLLIEEVSRAIKEEKPNVQFGVSPFGIWRPRNPRHVRGLDAYAKIYADSRRWLQRGWVDYLTPQLYWPTSAPQQRFSELLWWWRKQNTMNRHLWPGLAITRVGNRITADEIVKQINLIRTKTNDPGWILFTAKVLLQDRGGVTDALERLNDHDVPARAEEFRISNFE
ncbi:MAG TPA: family 10 glycosylhydrolase [Thermoanaerobaculia bacterium]|nr:family 10 glycosylhydrolase [Thermoanaerobaculia bacterium]